MTDKELSIKVDSQQTGSGLKDTAQDVQKLDQQFKKAEQAAQNFQGELGDVGRQADKLKGDQETLTQAIFKSEMAFEDAQSSSIALKSQYKKLSRQSNTTKEELQDLSNKITVAEEREHEAIVTTRELIKQYAKLSGSTDEVADEHTILAQKLQNAEGYINGIDNKAVMLKKSMGGLAGSVDHVGDEVQEVGKKVDRASDGIDKMGDTALRSEKSLDKLGDTAQRSNKHLEKIAKHGPAMIAFGNILSDMFQDAARGAVNFARESHQAFLDYDRGAREIFTLLPQASTEMRTALTRDARLLGTELGRLPEEMNQGIYMALSLGIPQDNVLDAVKLSSEAARAGVSDLASTLSTGQAIVNAYGEEIIGLERVYDLLFFTVKNGAVTIPELNGVMSEITSVAGETGVGLEEISAALIVMTKQGDSASEAAGLLSNMLTQLSITGTALGGAFQEAAGIGFKEFIAGGGNLAQAMQILQAHAQDTGVALGEMVGGGSNFFRDQQAMRGTLELTGRHLEDLVKYTNEAFDSTGEMGVAAAEMGEAAELGSLRAKASLEEFKIALGEAANPFMTKLYEGSVQFLTLWSGNKTSGVENLVEDLNEGNETTEDWIESVKKLSDALDTATHGAQSLLVDDKLQYSLSDSLNDAYRNLAAASDSYEDFITSMQDAGIEMNELYQFLANSGDLSLISMTAEEFYNLASAEAELARRSEEAAVADEKLGYTIYASGQEAATATTAIGNYTEASEAYAVSAEQVTAAEERRVAIQQELMGYWTQSEGPINSLIEAEANLAGMSGEWSEAHESAQQDVVAANDAIIQSYRAMAFEAVLAQSGVTESTLALGVELGIMTEEATAERLAFVETAAAIARLTENQDFLSLSTQQQATAVDLMIDGMVTTTTEAINLAGSYQTHLTPEMIYAAEKAEELYDPLNKIGSGDFSTVVNVETDAAKKNVDDVRSSVNALHDKTITIHVKKTGEEVGWQGPESGGYQKPDDARGYGGPVKAGHAYLVGDDKGKITPYSEMFIPATDGTILSPDDTQSLLTNFSEPTPVTTPDAAAPAPVTSGQSLTIQVQVTGYPQEMAERIGADTKDKVLEVATGLGFSI